MIPKDSRERKAAIIAACVTFGVALVVLVLLFVLTVGSDRRLMEEASMPEIQNDVEVFLEPELLKIEEHGDEDAPDIDEAAPQTPGEPDPAPEEQPVRVVKNEVPPKEEPVSNKKELVSTPKPNDVKTSTPKVSTEEEKRIASMQGKFKTDNNGSRTGSEAANAGSGGVGVSASGDVNGRKMESWTPIKNVPLTQKVTVKVNITIDADGKVTAATAVAGGNATQRAAAEKMARSSRWTPKAGAAPASGYMSITIFPN